MHPSRYGSRIRGRCGYTTRGRYGSWMRGHCGYTTRGRYGSTTRGRSASMTRGRCGRRRRFGTHDGCRLGTVGISFLGCVPSLPRRVGERLTVAVIRHCPHVPGPVRPGSRYLVLTVHSGINTRYPLETSPVSPSRGGDSTTCRSRITNSAEPGRRAGSAIRRSSVDPGIPRQKRPRTGESAIA